LDMLRKKGCNMTLTIYQGEALLPCWICRKLNRDFVMQTVHKGMLDNGISRVMIPICTEHQAMSPEEIDEVLRMPY